MKLSIVRMKVAQKERDKLRSRILKEIDKNHSFLKAIAHHPLQRKHLTQISEGLLPKVLKKASELDINELIEWSIIKTTTIRNLSQKIRELQQALPFEVDYSATQMLKQPTKAFRQNIRILVYTCNDLEIPYDTASVEEMIKRFYYCQFKDEVIPYFCAVGYDVSNYHSMPPRKQPFLECCQPKDVVNIK